jgi:hypothetical protein
MTDTDKTAATLDEAAADAVAEQTEEVVVEETEVEETAPVEEATADEELPTDHKERSNLGRTLAAVHRRQDDTDNRIDRMLDLMEKQVTANEPVFKDPLDDLDPNEPMTAGELREILNKREAVFESKRVADNEIQQRANNAYDQSYLKSFETLSTGMGDDELSGIVEELKSFKYTPTTNPEADAKMNFLQAERAYLRKRLAKPVGKKIPLKEGDVPGVVTNQVVRDKKDSLPKLDAAGESYLNFVRAEDGAEKADSLLKAAGKRE